jgi:hypothetical protein
MAAQKSIAVRLEGGLGDHVLGMRILRFIHSRYPAHDIVAYSDSHGVATQLQISAMSPFVTRVVPIFHEAAPNRLADTRRFETVRLQYLKEMLSSEYFFDTFGEDLLAAASVVLNVPIFDVLAHRPELVVPVDGAADAELFLAGVRADALLVGMHLAKFGGDRLEVLRSRIAHLLEHLLQQSEVVVLNMFTTCTDYVHWPEPRRTLKRQRSVEEGKLLQSLCHLSHRIVPCIDLPLQTVVALLSHCKYFIGVDNGIKHIAWSLGIPHTFFHPEQPTLPRVLRWMPDLHRMLLFDCSRDSLDRHIADAKRAIRG